MIKIDNKTKMHVACAKCKLPNFTKGTTFRIGI